MRNYTILLYLAVLFLSACSKGTEPEDPGPPSAGMYFPPTGSTQWETVTAGTLGWDESRFTDLYNYLQLKNTRAFIVMKNGRIVAERYFGTFTADSNWYWASAGKTMTAVLVGIAQSDGLLDIDDRTSMYLGAGWTSLPPAAEDAITIRHQLTMTTGLDDGVANRDCTDPSCLVYLAAPGSRWAYHNAPYTLLDRVVEDASGLTYNQYFQQKIRDRIGMNGLWIHSGDNNVYYSTPRSMARFGLLLLNKGKWDQTVVAPDTAYLNAQVSSSQSLNPSYGYLTWLNGGPTYMLPTLQFVFNGMLVPNAPADMYAALGKNDQKIYVVPSQGLVVIRMGDAAGNSQLALSSFDNELWGKLKAIIGY